MSITHRLRDGSSITVSGPYDDLGERGKVGLRLVGTDDDGETRFIFPAEALQVARSIVRFAELARRSKKVKGKT